MYNQLTSPPPTFESNIKDHLFHRKEELKKQGEEWIEREGNAKLKVNMKKYVEHVEKVEGGSGGVDVD